MVGCIASEAHFIYDQITSTSGFVSREANGKTKAEQHS
jgi:hypothetical protein